MRVEKYIEADFQKAMAKARNELGKEAMLLSTRTTADGVEIVAASDYDPEELASKFQNLPTQQALGAVKKKAEDGLWELVDTQGQPVAEQSPSLLQMQEELSKLRKLFESELAQLSWRESGKREPNRRALLSRLELLGFERDVQRKIVDKVLPCKDLELGWRRVQRLLNRIIKVSENTVLDDGGVIALLGCTGVGKTATAAKIASRFALRHGRNQVAFITTDSIRVGGQAQLMSLGSNLGIPVQAVSNEQEMENALESFSGRKLVIIDTAGISQRDKNFMVKIKSLTNEKQRIENYLVLSATTQQSVVNETINAFSGLDLAGTIITKIDENQAIGPVLSGIIKKKLPVAFIGNGQCIPDDLLIAEAGLLVSTLVSSLLDSTGYEVHNTMAASASLAARQSEQFTPSQRLQG